MCAVQPAVQQGSSVCIQRMCYLHASLALDNGAPHQHFEYLHACKGKDICSAGAYQAVHEQRRVVMVDGHVECQF